MLRYLFLRPPCQSALSLSARSTSSRGAMGHLVSCLPPRLPRTLQPQIDQLTAGPATVLNSRLKLGQREAYISFVGEDKRLDTWVPASVLGDEIPAPGPSRTNGQVSWVEFHRS